MIPSPWISVVLALGAFRVVRLIGWDDLAPIQRIRDWLTGASLDATSGPNAGFTTEQPAYVWSHRRPLLAHFLACPFCQGFWVSVIVYVCWIEWPRQTLYGLAPFALSAVVGLVAKNLDP